ncbi:MAG TPA: hypothetical protein VFF69_04475 [Phycisphaerales bacterium]|nr:hypothetical protein [Phycisphaerales bacterium]
MRSIVGTSLVLAALCIGAAVLAAGCNIVGPAFLLVHGPEKIPQQYELPRERPAVVFLDDRAGNVGRSTTRDRITAAAESALLQHKAVDRLLDSRAAAAVVVNEPRGEMLSISEVGRTVKADVVIYAVPELYTLSPDGQTFAPTARLRVKVIDAAADSRLWPEEREGYALEVTAVTKQGAPPTDNAALREAEEKFADLVGLRLAELFYKHEVESVSDERDRR